MENIIIFEIRYIFRLIQINQKYQESLETKFHDNQITFSNFNFRILRSKLNFANPKIFRKWIFQKLLC